MDWYARSIDRNLELCMDCMVGLKAEKGGLGG